MLRALAKYLRQVGTTFSQRYMEDTLGAHPGIVRKVVELFKVRFDPARAEDRATDASLAALIEEEIDSVPSLDEDRILRSFLRLVQATLRTNYFQPDAGGARSVTSPSSSTPARPRTPEPRPQYEIWVYSPRIEGVPARRQGRSRRDSLVGPARASARKCSG